MSTDIDYSIRQQVSGSEIITKEREAELLAAWLDRKEIWARDELILAHRKLVASMATKFSSSGANFSDLFNEGIEALIVAADRFDREKECRFSTYAAWWVFAQLREAVHRDIYSVKIGRSRNEKKVLGLLGIARSIIGPNLDAGVIAQIAEFSEIDVDVINRVDGAVSSRSASLNATIGVDGEDGTEMGDMIEDENAADTGAEAFVLAVDQRRLLERCFDQLTDKRAAQILRDRWLRTDEKSLKEIGEDFGVSAERIRQIERDALKQIRALIEEGGNDRADILSN